MKIWIKLSLVFGLLLSIIILIVSLNFFITNKSKENFQEYQLDIAPNTTLLNHYKSVDNELHLLLIHRIQSDRSLRDDASTRIKGIIEVELPFIQSSLVKDNDKNKYRSNKNKQQVNTLSDIISKEVVFVEKIINTLVSPHDYKNKDKLKEAYDLLEQEVTPHSIDASRITNSLLYEYENRNKKYQETLDNNLNRTSIIIFIIGTIGVIISLLLVFQTIISINRQILGLTIGANKVEKGNLDYKVDDLGSNELTRLSSVFNAMVTSLKTNRINLEEAKEAAEKANKAKSEFLANMSHEIRTPLNGVVGFSELMMNTEVNPSQRTYLSSIYTSATSLLDIINDILDFSKIEAGLMELEYHKTDLIEIGTLATNVISYQVKNKDIKVLLTIAPNTPHNAIVDPIRLRQVLVNLLSNAVKFTSKGHIELKIEMLESISEAASVLKFSVIDTGIGIDEKNQIKIFKAFSQEDASTTRKYGGTGLGLTISNKILNLMDSKLDLDSEVGKGSTFSFQLTLDIVKLDKEVNEDVFKNIKNVLIVDDIENNRIILRDMLKIKNISSDCVSSGVEAMDKLSATNNAYDLMIIDYNMPNMGGIDTIKEVRKTDTHLPIILLYSEFDEKEIHHDFINLNINQKIQKPIQIDYLFSTLSNIRVNTKIPINNIESDVQKFNLLLVEDDAMNILLAKTLLSKLYPNISITSALNGQEGVDSFIKEEPDIIFMDVQMPVMNGYDACKAIRKLSNGNSIPIIALTAGTIKGDNEKCFDAGMNDIVTKPYIQQSIKDIITKWLITEQS